MKISNSFFLNHETKRFSNYMAMLFNYQICRKHRVRSRVKLFENVDPSKLSHETS